MKKKFKLRIYNLVGKVWFWLGLQAGSRIILCFHGISDYGDKYTISKDEFIKIIDKFSKYYKFVTLNDLLVSKSRENLITITFDDGYKSILDVENYIDKKRLKPTIFVIANSKLVNKSEIGNSNFLIDKITIKRLVRKGWTIGCHSMTHANLKSLTKLDLTEEIIKSKRLMENDLKICVDYFAYPKGIYTNNVVNYVKKAHFKYAFTTKPNEVTHSTNFKIPRFVIEKEKIFGDYPYGFAKPIQLIRRFNRYEK